jgi:hypothetical protein
MLDIDVNETEIMIPEDALPSGRLWGDQRPSSTEAFASKNTPDTVSIEMRQEVRHHKGQVIEREVRAFPQGTHYSPLLVRRLPGEVMWAHEMVVTVGGPRLRHLRTVSALTP